MSEFPSSKLIRFGITCPVDYQKAGLMRVPLLLSPVPNMNDGKYFFPMWAGDTVVIVHAFEVRDHEVGAHPVVWVTNRPS